MNLKKLELAMYEAKRFLDKAKLAKERMKGDESYYWMGSKETSAVKRASLDLTRSLAELRKPH